MTMANEMLDILMGKHLDGEITPDEQRLLDQFLAADDAAREEFESFRRLHEQIRSAVGQALEAGRPMDEIFDAAWRKSSPARRVQNRIFGREWALAAAGLAAGLILGFVIHGMIMSPSESARPTPTPIAQNPTDSGPLWPSGTTPLATPGENRNVDWYTVTEPSGEQWLLEGYRRQQVMPAMYYGDL
jgi:anti-sigma factor RsiW